LTATQGKGNNEGEKKENEMPDQFVPTSILLPRDLKRKAQIAAILQDTNVSVIIRDLLARWIEEGNLEQDGAESSSQAPSGAGTQGKCP
jgi:hypothetical protein